ncbi:DgyrCDS9169 [Dimorphilus gyrociliatus]|uniref:DgyrCDS9169 n=1 Tax=Dimorphilus gyrociliatus TaxID=2664684 RepID=A0A7I8VW95_9ANNE|nr:DgyrCDS9169 [Dimorphilus gyrociliatus]
MQAPPPPPQSAYSQIPTYNQVQTAQTVYEQRETIQAAAQTVQQEKESGVIDHTYLPHKGIHGILKVVQCVSIKKQQRQIILTLIAYIISELAIDCSRSHITQGFFKILTLGSFVATLVVWAVLLLKLDKRIFRCCNWSIVLLGFHGVICVCFFFTDIVLAVQACFGADKASCAFGFFCLFAYGAGLIVAVRQYMDSKRPSVPEADTKY